MTNSTAGRYQSNPAERDTLSSVGEAAAQLAGFAGRKVDNVLDSAEEAARKVTAQASDAGENVKVVAGNMRKAVDQSLADQPMTTLLMAAAVGFVLGALWKT